MELPNREKLEAQFLKQLQGLSKRHRRELETHLAGTLDPSRVPAAFWLKVEKEREEELAAILILLFILAGDQMKRGAPSQSVTLNAISGRAEIWSRPKAREIATGYVQHSRERLEVAARDWTNRIKGGDGARLVPPVKETVEGIFSDARDEAIAVTSTTQARAAGGEAIGKELEIASSEDYWQTEEDSKVCPICAPMNGRKRDQWEAKFPEGPPAHPHCRCEIIYVNQLVEN